MDEPPARTDENALAALARLERVYDGPVPEMLRKAARGGGAAPFTAAEAGAISALFDRLAQQARAALAERRRAGADSQDAASCAACVDLARHRSAGLIWHSRAKRPRERNG